MSVEIENLSLVELRELQDKVATRIEEKETEDKAEVREELEKLARSRGFDLKTLVENEGGKKSGKKVPPKYRNPSNADETWTGRGRKPKWLTEALGVGGNIEDFAINS